jgi:hypothetical protein
MYLNILILEQVIVAGPILLEITIKNNSLHHLYLLLVLALS